MRYTFCPKCGGRLAFHEKGEQNRPHCLSCGFIFYQNPSVAVAVILIRDGNVLLGKRRSGRFQGEWCFPGGHVEWDEDVYDAARRECKEETGLDIEITTVYTVLSNYGPGFKSPEQQSVIIWFLAKQIGGVLLPGDDIEEVQYFSFHALPRLAFRTHEMVLKQLKDERLIES